MRVLVAGHLGYLGVELTSLLVDLGHDVVGLDTDYFGGCDLVASPRPLPMLRVDFREVDPSYLLGFDAVAHLAALSNDPLSDLNPSLTYDINVPASVRLAKATKAAGVNRFLFSSSCSLYGKRCDIELDERAPFSPVTAYAKSKIRVEQDLTRLADDNFSPVFLRNATAYGLSRRLRADTVVNNLVGQAATSGKILLHSDGTQWRPVAQVADIAQAFAQALAAPRAGIHNQAFNVGRVGENYQVQDIANLVAKVVPDSVVEHADGATADIRDYKVNFAKIRRALPGYQPQWNLRRGIEQLWAAFSDGGLTPDRFQGRTLFRLPTIQRLIALGELDDQLHWIRTRRLTPETARQRA